MSQEQMDAAAIGFIRERSDARQQYTVLLQEVRAGANKLQQVGNLLSAVASPGAAKEGSNLLDEFIADGGLEVLRSKINQRDDLLGRIESLDKTLRGLGID